MTDFARPFLFRIAPILVSVFLLPACKNPIQLRSAVDTGILATLPLDEISPQFLEGGGAWESWAYVSGFPDGTVLLAQFQISNLGPGQHRGLAVGMIVTPDGQVALLKNGRKRSDWELEATESGPRIRIAKHLFEIQPPNHHIQMDNSKGKLELWAKNISSPFRPGRFKFGGEALDLTVLAPRFEVTGTYQLPDQEEPRELGKGYGTALYSFSTEANYKQIIGQVDIHTFDQDTQLSLVELMAPADHGHKRIAFLLYWEGGKLARASLAWIRENTKTEKDSINPYYAVPRSFEFREARDNDPLQGTIELEPVFRYDWLDGLDNAMIRFLVKQVSHPVQYVFRAKYTLELGKGRKQSKTEGTGIGLIHILNRPPETF